MLYEITKEYMKKNCFKKKTLRSLTIVKKRQWISEWRLTQPSIVPKFFK